MEDEKHKLRETAIEATKSAQAAKWCAAEAMHGMWKIPSSAWGPVLHHKMHEWLELEATAARVAKLQAVAASAKGRVRESATPQKHGRSLPADADLEAGAMLHLSILNYDYEDHIYYCCCHCATALYAEPYINCNYSYTCDHHLFENNSWAPLAVACIHGWVYALIIFSTYIYINILITYNIICIYIYIIIDYYYIYIFIYISILLYLTQH